MNRKILLFFPHNFLELKSGVHSRIYNLCKYFKSRKFDIDLFTLKNYESSWEEEDYIGNDLINKIFFFDWRSFEEEKRKSLFNRVKIVLGSNKSLLPDLTSKSMIREFDRCIRNNQYDYIIISYAYWSKLIENPKYRNLKKVILIEDFLAKQYSAYSKEKVNLKLVIRDEIKRINKFDVAISVSNYEFNYFSKFAKKPIHYLIPAFYKKIELSGKKKPKFDVSFVGFDNVHNVRGIDWFLHKVAPRLPKKSKIAIIGKVCSKIRKTKQKNISYINYVRKLSDIYLNTKITISPMFSGTGLKIKIVESMMYGVPCVCTLKSLSGFPKKYDNGCLIANNPEKFIKIISELLLNKKLYREQSRLGKNFFMNFFEENTVYKKLDIIFLNT